MSNTIFGIPGVFKLLMESKGFPAEAGNTEKDAVEVTDDAARAYVLTMLAIGAGNSASNGPWGSHY